MSRKITYEQAREDHEYLWSIAPAYDMTGGYTDQQDLELLLKTPTKAMARDCYCHQIGYWFQAGINQVHYDPESIPWDDARVREIAIRHNVPTPFFEDDEA